MSLHCFKNGTEIVIAESADDAKDLVAKESGAFLIDIDDFEMMPDDKIIKVTCEDAPEGEEAQSYTAAEWAAMHGRSLLALMENC